MHLVRLLQNVLYTPFEWALGGDKMSALEFVSITKLVSHGEFFLQEGGG